jgi:predicted small secreted protein
MQRSLNMRIITATLSVLLFAGLAACNTVEGAGEDVEGGGEAISDTARDVERDISE